MKNLTPELAEILGLLCSEGSHIVQVCNYWSKDRGRDRYYKNQRKERIEFTNKDKKLSDHFIQLLKTQFDYCPKITKNYKVNICKKEIVNEILKHTELGHLKWDVPKFILTGDKDIKTAFIRGFFDGDGCYGKIARIISTNNKGMKGISHLLKSLDILHTLEKPQFRTGKKPCYTIQISRKQRETFLNMVKPFSKGSGNFCEGNH